MDDGEVAVHEVETVDEARRVVKILSANDHLIHACDTEVADIDMKRSPLGQGRVLCISCYSGPDLDFGSGKGTALWVDTTEPGVLEAFRPWLERESALKVWHNYGFDRHVLYNHGIDVRGFGGDTMHMARLWDASRKAGYSLAALTEELVGRAKVPMKDIFGEPKLRKDGTPGKTIELPPLDMLQESPLTRPEWIQYSVYDAKGTWLLYRQLESRLRRMDWQHGKNLFHFYHDYWRPFGELLTEMERNGVMVDVKSKLPVAERNAKADRDEAELLFRRWAASYCPAAWYMNVGSGAQIQTLLFGGAARRRSDEVLPLRRTFKVERSDFEALHAARLRLADEGASDAIQPASQPPTPPPTAAPAPSSAAAASEVTDLVAELSFLKVSELKEELRARGLKVSGRKAELIERLEQAIAKAVPSSGGGDGSAAWDAATLANESVVEETALSGAVEEPNAFLIEELRIPGVTIISGRRDVEIELSSLKLEHTKVTASGWPATDAASLRDLAGSPTDDPPVYGSAYEAFGGGEVGREACVALEALCRMGAIDTMLSNFILPLQELADSSSRIHCSLNLNTETGRLSSRAPNLQNQPALEKDKYLIRDAFTAADGNNLVVADYGQLELRLLAHMTNCKSMLDAFRQGGCFHSRTAMGMFAHVREAVERGDCLLEWDYKNGPAPAPLLKDMFGSERRRAKTLNFSIAYGKTAHGLSKDWGVTIDEANEMLRAWYADRPEVEAWQRDTKANARLTGATRTLLGRYRRLPGIDGRNGAVRGHMERAAINTPIQGGAADIMTLAMIKLHKSEKLREMGFKMLLQVHDEVMFEGPEELAHEAMMEVVACMQRPFDEALPSLLVDLVVDANVARTWYGAK